jgi:predicted histidine transporter YuiF (NhaC family)
MIKRCIIWFLVIAFLNFIITPTLSFAARVYNGPEYDISDVEKENKKSENKVLTTSLIILGAVVVIGLVAYLLVKSKKSDYYTDKPKASNQTSADMVSDVSEKLLTTSGELVIVKW